MHACKEKCFDKRQLSKFGGKSNCTQGFLRRMQLLNFRLAVLFDCYEIETEQ
jgi:hypothetical protein